MATIGVGRLAAGVAVAGLTGATAGAGMIGAAGHSSPRYAADTVTPSASTPSPAGSPAGADTGVRAALRARSAAVGPGTEPAVSRAGVRPLPASAQRKAKASTSPVARQDLSSGVTETVAPTDPRDIARGMLSSYGWSSDQFPCLDELYLHESNWNPSAMNASSGAYGIPQSLPGDKMASYGADWQTNPATQLAWGLAYIRDSYGSPCGAWGFWQSNNWY